VPATSPCSNCATNRSLAKVDRPYVGGERSKRPDIALAVTGLRIVTYNLCEGGQDRVSAIAALLRRQHADVIALVEANNRANVDTLGHELTMQVVYGDANSPASVAWLSRLPIRSSSNHRLPELAKTLLEVEVMWAAAPVRLFVTHLADRREEVAYPHEAEVQAILNVLCTDRSQPQLLVGDFNAIAHGDPVGDPAPEIVKTGDALPDAPRRTLQYLLDAGYVDCFRARHPRRPGFTYPARGPWLRLDYAFASPTMAQHLLTCDVVCSVLASHVSDHLPVLVGFGHNGRSNDHV